MILLLRTKFHKCRTPVGLNLVVHRMASKKEAKRLCNELVAVEEEQCTGYSALGVGLQRQEKEKVCSLCTSAHTLTDAHEHTTFGLSVPLWILNVTIKES